MRNRADYSLAMMLAARAAHREIFAEPARYVRLAVVRGQRTLVQIDASGDPYPVFFSKRAYRQTIYRTPCAVEFQQRVSR